MRLGAFILFSLIITQVYPQRSKVETNKKRLEKATFGAGCFWYIEAVFQELDGVSKVVSGYTGGYIKNPSYSEVCKGTTGHVEVIQISFDNSTISYEELLEVFWQIHDPTTPVQQKAKRGSQYRSSIFYHNEDQKNKAELYKTKLNESDIWEAPVVTVIKRVGVFYKAEFYHQNYFTDNLEEPYCTQVILPKLEKFRKVFNAKLRRD